MFKKTIEYTDFNGEKRKEDFYFNLNKAELMEMQLSESGGLLNHLTRIIKTKDSPELVKIFKDIILMAYGEKSPDGKIFLKSDEIRRNFECTEAYAELFMELATDSDSAAEFINALLPSDYRSTPSDREAIMKELSE